MAFEHKTETEARQQILDMVAEYCDTYHNKKGPFQEGDRIPYASRVYDHKEMVNLVDSSLEFWLTSGRYTDEFEKKLADYLGVRFCSLVNSGSSANLVAFMTLTSPLLGERRVKRGDEIITVACGFPTTVAPAIQFGAVPVFVDVTIPQYNIDAEKLEEALSEKTKAVMIAHTLGNPFDLRAVKAFCEKHGLWLVEDNCDALGTQYTMEEDGKVFTPDMVLGPTRRGLKVTYCTDTRPVPVIAEYAKDADLFICEGMYGEDGKEAKAREYKHMTFYEAARLAKEANPKQLWLTHYSPSLTRPEEFMDKVREIFPRAKAAKDAWTVELEFE